MTPLGDNKYSTLIRTDYLNGIGSILGDMPSEDRKRAGDDIVIQALRDYLELPEDHQKDLSEKEYEDLHNIWDNPVHTKESNIILFILKCPLEIARGFESNLLPENKSHIYRFNAALRHFFDLQNWNCVNCGKGVTGKPPWQEGTFIINTIPNHSIEFKMDISTKEGGLRAKLCLHCFRSFLMVGCKSILNEIKEDD